jgi:5-methylcytosine-specific restriction endonuclease McrA
VLIQGELFGDIGRRKRRVGAAPGPEYHVPPGRRQSRKRWVAAHKEQIDRYQRNYRKMNGAPLARKKLAASRAARLEGIVAYGGKCGCCGETRIGFLTLDHINGRAGDPYRITGQKAWARLKARGWPKDNFQLLCFNCNCAKGIYGRCPHATDAPPKDAKT